MRRINWRDPKMQILGIILGGLSIYIILMARLGGFTPQDLFRAIFGLMFFQFGSVNKNVMALVIDILIFGVGGLVFWVAFFSQFVLPVRTVQERGQVAERLLSTLGSTQGPAILIQNGQVIDHSDERTQRGPGVILLDTASAAVLHNQTSFTRAVGPGLVFTRRNESIFSAIDLHTQIRRIGPLEGDLDPESEEAEEASDDERKAWRDRWLQTSGLTRDGVEVAPNITAIFRLNAKPGDGNTRFGYNQDAVWRAVAHQGIDPTAPQDADSRLVAWDWLPVQIAADLWREYLRKYKFNELFEFPSVRQPPATSDSQPHQRRTVFENIVDHINSRLKKDLVDELNEVGEATGRKFASRERQLMLDRGLQILSVSLSNLRFARDPIEMQLIERWPNTWLLQAQEEMKLIEQQHVIENTHGRNRAQEDFATRASRPLYRRILPRPEASIPEPTLPESLELLVQGTMETINANPELLPQLGDVVADLTEIKDWLRQTRSDNGADADPPPANAY